MGSRAIVLSTTMKIRNFLYGKRWFRGLSRNGVKNYSKGPCVTFLE